MWYKIEEYSTDWNKEVECRTSDGKIEVGVPKPFWCGSDCPCSTLEDWRNGVAACGSDYCAPYCWEVNGQDNIREWKDI